MIDGLFGIWQRGGSIFVIGNASLASTAWHFASDVAEFTIVGQKKKRFKVMALVDNAPLVSAWTKDSGLGSIFEEQIKSWMQEGDVLGALSGHAGSGEGDAGSWSENVVRAVR